MQYFFRLLDVDKVGALTGSSIRYLFRDVARRMAECGFEAPNIDDVKVGGRVYAPHRSWCRWLSVGPLLLFLPPCRAAVV